MITCDHTEADGTICDGEINYTGQGFQLACSECHCIITEAELRRLYALSVQRQVTKAVGR